MDDTGTYLSCIKIPSTTAKQSTVSSVVPQNLDIKETLIFNNELILLANRLLGEGKWSHSVTSQTIDFVEGSLGKYVCGCVTFVKIQLQSGVFHEDMGYSHTEAATKGLAMHCARVGSLTDAFKKVLTYFGIEIKNEINKFSRKSPNSKNTVKQNEDSTKIFAPCAQSTPIISHKNDEQKDKSDDVHQSKSPNAVIGHIAIQQTVTSSKSPTQQSIQSILSKTSGFTKNHIQSNVVDSRKEQDNIKREQEPKKVLSEEELLRLERKRKQMEKQAEYKRRMKEREQEKCNEIKNINPKY